MSEKYKLYRKVVKKEDGNMPEKYKCYRITVEKENTEPFYKTNAENPYKNTGFQHFSNSIIPNHIVMV